jgi:hypothetical protein
VWVPAGLFIFVTLWVLLDPLARHAMRADAIRMPILASGRMGRARAISISCSSSRKG